LVEIEDVRDTKDAYKLDTSGFQLFKKAASHKTFVDDAKVKEEYYPESIELIKELTGASTVVLFDHTIRTHFLEETPDTPDQRQPAAIVHVDQSDKAAENRVRRHLPASDIEDLLKRRFQIINLWRPISNPALDLPLAFCDYQSVDKDDFVITKLLNPQPPNGESIYVKYNPSHKWKYFRGMEPDEFVLIKCFDSRLDVARFTPHTAFIDPSTPPDAPLRKSIELRALVFYD
jgi:hypothetical protein